MCKSKVNISFACLHRPGNGAHNCKMANLLIFLCVHFDILVLYISSWHFDYPLLSHQPTCLLSNVPDECYKKKCILDHSLGMTDVFLCRWEFTGSEEEAAKSIPYQLQKLFLHLQVLFN